MIDTETTGIHPGDRVVQIAVIILDEQLVEVGRWSSLVNPGLDYVPAAAVHCINPHMLADQPTFGDIHRHLRALLAGRTVIGHNVAFDVAMINSESIRATGQPLIDPIDTLCTLKLARVGLAGLSDYRLATCCSAAQVTLSQPHDAAADAAATADLLRRLRRQAAPAVIPLAGEVSRRQPTASQLRRTTGSWVCRLQPFPRTMKHISNE